MLLELWSNFTKKEKSTLQPSTAADASFDVYLKEGTTVDKPSFLLDLASTNYNYARWEGRYYFVTNIKRDITGQYEIQCETDHGATFKGTIGSSILFVERASNIYDVNINDDFLSQKQTYQKDFDKFNPFADNNYVTAATGGSYVVRTVGADADLSQSQVLWNPGTTCLLMHGAELSYALDFLFTSSNFTDVITDGLVKSFFNPFQYFLSIKWVPISISRYQTAHPSLDQFHKLQSGWWAPMKTDGGLADNVRGTLLEGYDVIRKKIPMMARRYNDFRDFNANWTRFKFYVPFVGNVDIDPIDYYSNSLYAVYKIDLISSKALFMIEYDNGNNAKVIFQHSFDFGVDLQIGQNASNVMQLAGDVAGAAANIAVGNYVAAAGEAVNAISNIISPTPSYKGQPSTRVSYDTLEFGIIRYTADSAEFMTNFVGRPLYQNRLISQIPGYIKCGGADLAISGLAGDREAVNALLNGGFFYE